MKNLHIFLLSTNYFIHFTCGSVRFAFYEEALTFNRLSRDVKDVNKERCAARCHSMSCRGIHFNANNCRILYETIDVVESERNKYHQVSLSSSGGNEILMNVYHKCSSMKPCRHGAECEAVEWIYQCNCTGTEHYGPMCETAGNPWAAPDGWETLHPQLNLNLDEDVEAYTLHGGAMHVTTENGHGFQTNGGSDYVDLGNWLNETCFVDVKNCEQGYTLFTYLNIMTAPGSKFTGYISSTVKSSPGYYGAALYGYNNKMQFRHIQDGTAHGVATDNLDISRGWMKIMVIYYSADHHIELYIDNVPSVTQNITNPNYDVSTITTGHIVLGRYLASGSGITATPPSPVTTSLSGTAPSPLRNGYWFTRVRVHY